MSGSASCLWQSIWDEADQKLHQIRPVLGKWKGARRHVCRDETVLTPSIWAQLSYTYTPPQRK